MDFPPKGAASATLVLIAGGTLHEALVSKQRAKACGGALRFNSSASAQTPCPTGCSPAADGEKLLQGAPSTRSPIYVDRQSGASASTTPGSHRQHPQAMIDRVLAGRYSQLANAGLKGRQTIIFHAQRRHAQELRKGRRWLITVCRASDAAHVTGHHARLTNWSMTRFSPALSNSTVSLLPST
jgi:hypothetical protein